MIAIYMHSYEVDSTSCAENVNCYLYVAVPANLSDYTWIKAAGTHLFLLSVLVNRRDMALMFWETVTVRELLLFVLVW